MYSQSEQGLQAPMIQVSTVTILTFRAMFWPSFRLTYPNYWNYYAPEYLLLVLAKSDVFSLRFHLTVVCESLHNEDRDLV